MKKNWLSVFFVLFALPVFAQDDAFVSDGEQLGQIHVLKKPKCSDKDFQNKIIETAEAFFKKNEVQSTMTHRQKVLKLKGLNNFIDEQAEGFLPEKDYNTANALITVKINEHVKNDDIVLCKQTEQKGKAIYVLAYPYLDNFRGHILNLDNTNSNYDAVSFIYP